MKRFLLLSLMCLLFGASSYAQQKVSGNVSDAGGLPLIGATVLVKGTSSGTITDIDGNFDLNVADLNSTLVISFTGYSTQEVPLNGQNNVRITLEEGLSLDEVVVTGYSVDTRRSTPGSVSTVDSRALQVAPSGNVEQQLQGRVPGLTVITNGQPGTESQVRVRGFGALGGNAPLYVVDGVPVGNVDFLSPDDIATTTVLKDATAASIYGARAAGGVIVYTTKKGKRGDKKVHVTYDGMIGVTTPGQSPGTLTPQEQADWTWAAVRNGAILNGTPLDSVKFNHPQYGTWTPTNSPTIPDYLLIGPDAGVTGSINLDDYRDLYNIDPELGGYYQVVKANKEGTDWYDAITRNAMLHRHNLGFAGGGESSRFYVGMGMQEQEGIVLHQNFSRYTFRVNTEFDVLPFLRIGENIQATYRAARLLLGDGGGAGSSDDENVILSASRMSPIIPVEDEFGGYAGTAAPGFNNPANPVAALDGQKNNRAFNTGIIGNVYAELEPIEDLVIRTSFGGGYGSFANKNYTRRSYENSENNASFGFSQNSGFGTSWVWTNTANYKKTFGIHTLDVLVGQEALNIGSFRFTNASGINPFSQSEEFVTISTTNSRVVEGGHLDGVNFASYFGRLNYDLNDKYILSFVLRRDGSSRFGAENKYGTFPAVSAAWRISSEKFMEGVGWIDDLKIRGGYGIMGNSNNVAPLNQYSLYGTSVDASSYDIDGTNSSATPGFYRIRIGNPFAKWEKAITSNIGFDALLFNGKVDFGVEFWKKTTEDLLFEKPVSAQLGNFAQVPSVNVGKMENKGVDITLTNKGKLGRDLGYEVNINGGFLSNKIVELAPNVESLPNSSADYRGITPILNQIGYPISSFYGYQVEGIFADQAAVDAAADQADAAPGRFQFKDLNSLDTTTGKIIFGVPDGKITTEDRTYLGDPVPDFTGGLTIKLFYKNFELELYSFASIGNEIYNVSRVFTDFYPLFPGAAVSDRVKDSWTFDDPSGEIPIFETNSNFSTNTQSNSFYVEDGSYFRLQNLTLSYNIPTSTVNRWKMEKLRIFASVNNLLTITGYDGLDPSVGGAADTNFGVDLGNYPITRSWTFGVNVGF